MQCIPIGRMKIRRNVAATIRGTLPQDMFVSDFFLNNLTYTYDSVIVSWICKITVD